MKATRRGEPLPLDAACRAELHAALARLLGAGFAAEQALETSRDVCGGRLGRALGRAAAAVRKGAGMSSALERAGLVLPCDRALLHAAEVAGRLDRACEALGRRYEAAHARSRALMARLLMPAAVGTLALFLVPLPALVAGDIGALAYLGRTCGALALVAVVFKLAAGEWRRYQSTGWPAPVAASLERVPVWGALHRAASRCEALSGVLVLLQSGVPAVAAVNEMARAQTNPLRAAELGRAAHALDHGRELSRALREAGLLDSASFAAAQAGEAAGRLEQSLVRSVRHSSLAVDERLDTLATWLPRVVYGCLAAWAAAGLVSGGIGPN